MQVVGYETERADDNTPALFVAEEGQVRREPLTAGQNLAYALGERRCAGVLDGETHRNCTNDTAPYCDHHAGTWVCARCTGTCLKDEMDCYEDHAIYLAAFAPATFKVGVTREWRLGTRLREQGADRAAHLRTVENGRIAREIESQLAAGSREASSSTQSETRGSTQSETRDSTQSETRGSTQSEMRGSTQSETAAFAQSETTELTDRVRVPDKITGLHRTVDAAAWSAALAEFDPIETFTFDYGFELDSAPVPETVATGDVVGVQGRVLVLKRGGTNYAVDMRDLVGYEIRAGTTDQTLQSSLGSF